MARTKERRLSSPARKACVVVMYGAYAIASALWIGAGGLHPAPVAVAVVLLLLLSMTAWFVLFERTRYWKWGNSPDTDLDEFQIASRNAAYKSAYVILAGLTMLIVVGFRLASDMTRIVIPESAHEVLFWGWFALVLTLPAALLAWTERPIDDEDVAEMHFS